jgi:hypothetical protein
VKAELEKVKKTADAGRRHKGRWTEKQCKDILGELSLEEDQTNSEAGA